MREKRGREEKRELRNKARELGRNKRDKLQHTKGKREGGREREREREGEREKG